MKHITLTAIAALLLAGASLSAHHSFAAEFDINKPITLSGTVTKVEWVNPHVYVYLDVKARRAGVTRANFGQGQTVTINGYHAKDNSNFAFMRKMTFADGHSVELWLGDDEAKK